jgi:hypothetical protein
MLAQLWTLSQNEMFQQWKIGHIVRSVFPFSVNCIMRRIDSRFHLSGAETV